MPSEIFKSKVYLICIYRFQNMFPNFVWLQRMITIQSKTGWKEKKDYEALGNNPKVGFPNFLKYYQ